MQHWDAAHPYRLRTWLRSKLPWFIINLGVVDKANNCEAVGAEHWWYNINDQSSGCYHCEVVREGRLWEAGDAKPTVQADGPAFGGSAAEPERQ